MTTLGVRLRDSQLSITAMRELAQLAERKGYECVGLPGSARARGLYGADDTGVEQRTHPYWHRHRARLRASTHGGCGSHGNGRYPDEIQIACYLRTRVTVLVTLMAED